MLLIGSFLSLITGLALGSFMMVLIPRLYYGEKGILLGRSHCPQCKHSLTIKNLVPLVSFILQKGKCIYCEKKISLIYPIVEIVTAFTIFTLFVSTSTTLLEEISFLSVALFILLGIHLFALIFTFFYDLLYYEISDVILIPAIVIALLQTVLPPNTIFPTLLQGLIGASIPLIIFMLQIVLSKGKWLGLGDLRIGLYMGLLLGIEKTVLALIITYMLGALIAIILLVSKKATKKTPLPFGPFLVSGTIIALFLGDIIVNWYFNELLLLM